MLHTGVASLVGLHFGNGSRGCSSKASETTVVLPSIDSKAALLPELKPDCCDEGRRCAGDSDNAKDTADLGGYLGGGDLARSEDGSSKFDEDALVGHGGTSVVEDVVGIFGFGEGSWDGAAKMPRTVYGTLEMAKNVRVVCNIAGPLSL